MKGKDVWKEEWIWQACKVELERFNIGTAVPAWGQLAEETEQLCDGLAGSIGYGSYRELQRRCADGKPMSDEERQAFLWFLAERAKIVDAMRQKTEKLNSWLKEQQDKIKDEWMRQMERMAGKRLSGAQYWSAKGPFGTIECRIDGFKQKAKALVSAEDAAMARKNAFSVAMKYYAEKLMDVSGEKNSRGRSF